MKKSILFIATIVLLVGGALWFFMQSSGQPTGSSQNIQFPTSGNIPVPTAIGSSTVTASSTRTSIITNDGGSIHTNDFITDSSVVAYPTAGYYHLGYHTPIPNLPDPSATDHPPYTIEYISGTQYFNVSLLAEPIGMARIEAEQYLEGLLGIPQDQMCRLQYMVSVPWSVNPVYASRNLGFSFCPGATPLPQ